MANKRKSPLQKQIDKAKNKERYAKKKQADAEQIKKWKDRDTDASGRDVG